ncbi:hypothetical protein TWF106_000753 [Orbilia oligospora]|uniref:Macro domain-containing protein n=1 Tax=Orbilia oligospora TaxID=2813651 RepID=A0A7C8QYE6_ORBOL|nr:hypothetical protein TWF106_000753 [Orbilia oligospora]
MASFSRIPVKSLEELDSSNLTNLYTSGKLDASIAQTAILPPSATFNDQVILVQMDMTRMAVDAIVNAANKSLLGGGGIDGAIHRAAGRGLYDECFDLHGCETGEAKITKGYRLPAKHVIHTVGPIYWDHKDAGRDPAEFLKNCYVNSLDVARRNGCKSVAFPCISTGIYGYPNDRAAVVACRVVREYLEAQLEETLFGTDDVENVPENIGETVEDKEEKIVVSGKKEEGDVEEGEVKDTKPAETSEKIAEDTNGEDVIKDEQKEVPETKDEKTADEKAESKVAGGEEEEEEGNKATKKGAVQPFISQIEKVIFCVFLDKDLTVYEDVLPYVPLIPDFIQQPPTKLSHRSFFPPADPKVEGAIDKLEREATEKPEGSSTDDSGSSNQPAKEQPKDTPGV